MYMNSRNNTFPFFFWSIGAMPETQTTCNRWDLLSCWRSKNHSSIKGVLPGELALQPFFIPLYLVEQKELETR